MSVYERIEDSKLLFAAGSLEGAMTSVLIAVAATSRKRYPDQKLYNDSKAFQTFLQDERPKITAGIELKIDHDGKTWTLEHLLYKLVRCELIHEAELAEKISFDWGDFLLDKRGTTEFITFSSELIIRLAYVVETAPENQGVFPTGRYDSLPRPTPLKTALAVEYTYGELRFEMLCAAASIRDVESEETGEIVTWLHCHAKQTWNGQIHESHDQSFNFLIPTRYITRVAAAEQHIRVVRRRRSADIGVYKPDKPAPPNALSRDQIDAAIKSMQIPVICTTVVLERPAYERDEATIDTCALL